MLTQCPNCENAIVVSEHGIHTCQRCEARIWIGDPDNPEDEDKVLISPEVWKERPENFRGGDKAGHHPFEGQKDLSPFMDADAAPSPAPWEKRYEIGLFRALKATWKLSVFAPTQFFSNLKTSDPTKGVMTYGWIFMTISIVFWALYRMLFLPAMMKAAQEAGQQVGPIAEVESQIRSITMVIMLGAPIWAALSLALNAAAYHIVLRLLGAEKAGLKGTLRVVSYASSPMLFLALPIFGDIFAFVWNFVVSVMGISKVHELSNGRAILVVLLPPIALYAIMLFIMRFLGGEGVGLVP